jgi:hypothetical protein
MVARTDMPPHARAGWIGRGHRVLGRLEKGRAVDAPSHKERAVRDVAALRTLLLSLVERHSIRAAILSTASGELLAAEPWPDDVEARESATEWAREQAKPAATFRRHLEQTEFSVLYDEGSTDGRLHYQAQQVGSHLLVLLFSERDRHSEVRKLSRDVVPLVAAAVDAG